MATDNLADSPSLVLSHTVLKSGFYKRENLHSFCFHNIICTQSIHFWFGKTFVFSFWKKWNWKFHLKGWEKVEVWCLVDTPAKSDWLIFLRRRNSNSSVIRWRSGGYSSWCFECSSNFITVFQVDSRWFPIYFIQYYTKSKKACPYSYSFDIRRSAIFKMGKKRKRAQTKQNWSSTNSRKQKKRRKTRGYGFNQAKVPKEVDGSRVKLSNTTDDCNMLELTPLEKSSSSSSVCNFNYTSWSNVRLCGISAIFSRLNTCARMLQRPTVECFRSIRNVFLLLNWLKQIFGCGLQTLGKVSWM